MPPRESLRPVTNADVDEFVRVWATRDERPRRVGSRAPIVEADIGWSDAPAPRSRRRHPVADADDWGLAGGDAWVTDPHEHHGVHDWEAEHLADAWASGEHPADARAPDGHLADAPAPRERQADTPAPRERPADALAPRERLADRWAPDGRELSPDRIEGVPDAIAGEPDFGLIIDGAEIGVSRMGSAVEDAASVAPASTGEVREDGATVAGARRTIVITGRGAEGPLPRRRGWEASLPPHERSGFKPDRLALWAVLLGVLLLLVAATSSHAAILAAHHVR